jgi:hypothetical protein
MQFSICPGTITSGKKKITNLPFPFKKKAKEVMLASHTEDATMDIDAEIPADRQQLKDLIRHEARAMAKKMIDSAVEEKLKSMQMPVSKNAGRGQQRPGASTKRNAKAKAKRGEQNGRRGSASRNANRNITQSLRDEQNNGWTQVSMLNYSHSRIPRARPHGRTDKSKRPESHPTKCVRARIRCI